VIALGSALAEPDRRDENKLFYRRRSLVIVAAGKASARH